MISRSIERTTRWEGEDYWNWDGRLRQCKLLVGVCVEAEQLRCHCWRLIQAAGSFRNAPGPVDPNQLSLQDRYVPSRPPACLGASFDFTSSPSVLWLPFVQSTHSTKTPFSHPATPTILTGHVGSYLLFSLPNWVRYHCLSANRLKTPTIVISTILLVTICTIIIKPQPNNGR